MLGCSSRRRAACAEQQQNRRRSRIVDAAEPSSRADDAAEPPTQQGRRRSRAAAAEPQPEGKRALPAPSVWDVIAAVKRRRAEEAMAADGIYQLQQLASDAGEPVSWPP